MARHDAPTEPDIPSNRPTQPAPASSASRRASVATAYIDQTFLKATRGIPAASQHDWSDSNPFSFPARAGKSSNFRLRRLGRIVLHRIAGDNIGFTASPAGGLRLPDGDLPESSPDLPHEGIEALAMENLHHHDAV